MGTGCILLAILRSKVDISVRSLSYGPGNLI
jgi:hypothetical protein